MRALVVNIAAGDVEQFDLACDALWQLGVRAIEERATSAGVELWTSAGQSDGAAVRAATTLDGRWQWRFVDVEEATDELWRDHATAMWIRGDLVIVPAWQDRRFDSGVLAIEIEPASAFGLGDHPTTALSLRALASLLADASEHGQTVLDVGCGTGVLAITAARMGARTVRAVDVSSAAVEATISNSRANGVADRVAVDTEMISNLRGTYDIVVANILAPVLVSLAADLKRLTASTGTLVISGILADAHDHVVNALAPMEVVGRDERDGWVALSLQHRPDT